MMNGGKSRLNKYAIILASKALDKIQIERVLCVLFFLQMLALYLQFCSPKPAREDSSNPYDSRGPNNHVKQAGTELIPPNTDDCKAKNTYLLPSGDCACVEGFEFGDPQTMAGCYNCPYACPESSSCVFPGKCECLPGYQDLHLNSSVPIICVPIAPELISIVPDSVVLKSKTKFTNMSYVFQSNVAHQTVFCKFGNITVPGKLDFKGHAVCPVPYQKEGAVEFYMSFDNKTWSIDSLEFYYIQGETKTLKYLIGAIGIICIITGIFLIQQQTREEIQNESIDEDEPFSTIPKKDVPIEEVFET